MDGKNKQMDDNALDDGMDEIVTIIIVGKIA